MNYLTEITVGHVSEWLTQAVQDVSETMFGQAAHPAAQGDKASSADQLLVACIGIRGDCRLEVAMYFPQALANRLASLSLEMPVVDLDEKMVSDVAGEFSNMVVGAVKSRVSDLEVSCAMTVPRVVRCAQDAPDSAQKVQAALAVIRGSAGPRTDASARASQLAFQVGAGLLRVDLYF